MNILIAAFAFAGCGMSPAEGVASARKDVESLPAAVRPYIRYLSLGEMPEDAVADMAKILSGHVNALSTTQGIVPAFIVLDTGGKLLRLNIRDYHWSVDLWESLAAVDPYFHLKIEWPGGVWSGDGKDYAPGAFRVNALAPWLSEGKGEEAKANLAALVLATESQVPIVRGDWFLNQTAIQQDRKPGYYDFLGVKDTKTFEALAGFDAKIAALSGRVDREAVAISGVTTQPRAIVRVEGVRPIWKSFDFRKAVDKKNPLRILGPDIEKDFDATEQFALLKNGFWATALFNGKGDRQDFAPQFIARDTLSKSNDPSVHVNMSCIRCHTEGGLQTVAGWTRKPGFAVQSPDEEKLRELREQYYSNLSRLLDRDRGVYADAVKEATGWTTKEWSAKYSGEWERYEDARVDLDWAARDLHTTPKNLKEIIEAMLKAPIQGRNGNVDLVVAAFARGEAVGIRTWEEAYPLAQITLRGGTVP